MLCREGNGVRGKRNQRMKKRRYWRSGKKIEWSGG
jgi:hypothetical protein